MALPNQTDEERRAALEKAAAARHARAELRTNIKEGKISIEEVLTTEDNPVIDKLKVFFERFFGLGNASFTGEEEKTEAVVYDTTQPTLRMVAEPQNEYGKKTDSESAGS